MHIFFPVQGMLPAIHYPLADQPASQRPVPIPARAPADCVKLGIDTPFFYAIIVLMFTVTKLRDYY